MATESLDEAGFTRCNGELHSDIQAYKWRGAEFGKQFWGLDCFTWAYRHWEIQPVVLIIDADIRRVWPIHSVDWPEHSTYARYRFHGHSDWELIAAPARWVFRRWTTSSLAISNNGRTGVSQRARSISIAPWASARLSLDSHAQDEQSEATNRINYSNRESAAVHLQPYTCRAIHTSVPSQCELLRVGDEQLGQPESPAV